MNEAMASALPVLGSVYSQAVDELCSDGETGWTFRTDVPAEIDRAIDAGNDRTLEQLDRSHAGGRAKPVEGFTPEYVADQMVAVMNSSARKKSENSPQRSGCPSGTNPLVHDREAGAGRVFADKAGCWNRKVIKSSDTRGTKRRHRTYWPLERRPQQACGTAGRWTSLRALIRRHHPDVVHCHNTFPLISPSAYYAAKIEGVPVVQTLHNSRLLCPNGLLLRDRKVCEDCLGRFIPWPGVLHGCYRGNRAASAVVAAMLAVHRARRTWTRAVDRYIAPHGILAAEVHLRADFPRK